MKPKLLYVTDLHYQAKGREYYKEDLYLSYQLSKCFDLVLCHPQAAKAFLDDVDLVFFRNTGPVLYFFEVYGAFQTKAKAIGAKVFNELTGKADMVSKQYLIELARDGYPVIPSVDSREELGLLPVADQYVIKLKLGADSVGMEFVSENDLHHIDLTDRFLQPAINFIYEVSFYFLNRNFQYALYAPDPNERWRLELYEANQEDLQFARKFVEWNDIDYGIQRIDACRLAGGDLLLMEIEDLNPYLSLDLLTDEVREKFVTSLSETLTAYAKK